MFINFVTFIVAACSIIYELAFSYLASIIYGNTTIIYSITIGLFLFFLGVGTLIYDRLSEKIPNHRMFIIVEIILSFIGFISSFAIFFFSIYFNETLSMIFSYLIVIIIATLSGMEIPLLTSFRRDKKYTNTLSIDYFGSLVGTLLFAFVLLPYFNIVDTLIITSIVNLTVSLLFSIYMKDKLFTFILSIILIIMLVINIKIDIEEYVKSTFIKEKIERNLMYNLDLKKKPIVTINRYINSPYQEIMDANITMEIEGVGKINDSCLYIDGNNQICDSWVDNYHTFLCKLPLAFYDKRDLDVLILGGGDLVCAKYLLDSNMVKHIDLVDIDNLIVDYAKKYVTYNKDIYKDPRLDIHIDDAFHYVINSNKHYDLIIDDLPVITNEKLLPLLSVEFTKKLNLMLKDDSDILSTMVNTIHNLNEINQFACGGFKKLLYVKGFNISNPFSDMDYIDRFLYFSRSNNYIFKNNMLKGRERLIVGNGKVFNISCNTKLKINSIFNLDYDLMDKE